jgi:hypothetical protein
MNDYFEFEGVTDDLLLEENSNYLKNETEKKSSFSAVIIAKAVGDVAQGVGNIAQASATKKEAEAKIKEIGGKRQAQLSDCENNKAFKKFADAKYRRNKIKDCQEEVKKRLDAEEQEQKEIVRRMTAIEENKLTSDLEKEKSNIDEKKSSKKLYVIGGIVALTLVLGTIIFIKSRK